MSVTAIMLSYHREPNIGRIIDALRKQPVDEIVLINNNPKHYFRLKDVTTINCGKNMGCSIRHAVGLVAKTEWCLFIDDDQLPERNMVENLLGWGKQCPEAVLGLYGRRLKRGRFPYSKSPPLRAGEKPVDVDVVMGKVHLCKREKLVLPFELAPPGYDHFQCDDIALSLANLAAGNANYLVPFGGGQGTQAMDEFGIGLGHAEGWWEARDKACMMMRGEDV